MGQSNFTGSSCCWPLTREIEDLGSSSSVSITQSKNTGTICAHNTGFVTCSQPVLSVCCFCLNWIDCQSYLRSCSRTIHSQSWFRAANRKRHFFFWSFSSENWTDEHIIYLFCRTLVSLCQELSQLPDPRNTRQLKSGFSKKYCTGLHWAQSLSFLLVWKK